MNHTTTEFVKELIIGILFMIDAVVAGAIVRAACGIPFVDFPIVGIIKAVLIGGLCVAFAVTTQRIRRSVRKDGAPCLTRRMRSC